MLEYEIHQNNNSEHIKYLRKKLITDVAKLTADNAEPPAASTRPPARKQGRKLKKPAD